MSERIVPEGYRLEWVPDLDWKVGGSGHKCRIRLCPKPAVAALARQSVRGIQWWHYCESHLYGRKIEGGLVMEERLVELEPDVRTR